MFIHDPTHWHSPITDFAKSVQVVVVNEDKIAIWSALRVHVRNRAAMTSRQGFAVLTSAIYSSNM